MKKDYFIIAVTSVLSVIALGLNFLTPKAPASDPILSGDISTIQEDVGTYASKNNALPADLSAVILTGDVKQRIGQYQYKKGAGGKFQICTTFATDTTSGKAAGLSDAAAQDPYTHPKGFACIDYEIYDLGAQFTDPATPDQSQPMAPIATGNQTTLATLCATGGLPNATVDTGTISKLDTSAGTVIIQAGTFRWLLPASDSLVYDASCKASTVSALKIGMSIEILHTDSGIIQSMKLH